MNINKSIILAVLLLVVFTAKPIAADDATVSDQPFKPSAEAMILDGLIYRPIALAGTIIGAGVFIATLPFSLPGGNADVAGQRLVVEPAHDTFTRCLGCLPGHSSNQYQRDY